MELFSDNTQVSVGPGDAFSSYFIILLLLLYLEIADIHLKLPSLPIQQSPQITYLKLNTFTSH